MSVDPIITILSEDSELIIYRKSLRKIAGTVTATILLQQMMFRSKKRDEFYKFKSPCAHKLYKEDDSWTEELGFSIKEFDNALKKIGTKITRGVSKNDALAKTDPTGIIIYWTDASRITWYQLNRDLLTKLLSGIYLESDQESLSKKPPKEDIPLTESPSETTPETSPPGEKSPSDPGLTNTPQRDTFQDFQPYPPTPSSSSNPAMVASIGRHTDQEMLASTEVSMKGPPLMIGDTLVTREIISQILELKQEKMSLKEIAEKVSLPLDLINDIFIMDKFYPKTEEGDPVSVPHAESRFLSDAAPPVSSNEVVSTNVRVKTVEELDNFSDPDLTDILTELVEDEALAADDFSDLTTPSPIVARPLPANGKLLSESDATHLRTFGSLPGEKLLEYDEYQEIRRAQWDIRELLVERAIIYYIKAVRTKHPNFSIPNDDGRRGDWYKSAKGHLQDYRIDDLPGLYQLAIDKLDKAGMTFSRPGSLTKTLPDIVNQATPTQEKFDLAQYKIVPPTPVDIPPVKSTLTPQQIDEKLAKAREATKNAKD